MARIAKEQRLVNSASFLATLTKKEDGKLLYPKGIEVGVEKVIGPKNSKDFYKNDIVQVTVILSILDDLDKGILGYEYDDNGEKVSIEDDNGEISPKLVNYPSNTEGIGEVAFYFKISKGKVKEEGSNMKCRIFSLSSFFPLVNTALIETGGFENPHNNNIDTSTDEIKEVLEGFTFMAGAEWDSFKGGRRYRKLVVNSTDV